jgi:hypothetical protein
VTLSREFELEEELGMKLVERISRLAPLFE